MSPIINNLRAADAAGGLRGDGGERELADGDLGPEIGGKAGGADSATAGADGEEVEIIVASGVGAVIGLGAGVSRVSAAAAGREGGAGAVVGGS